MNGIRALLVRNLTIQTVGEGVSMACGLASSAMLSRHLGLAGFGVFNYAFAFIYFFLTLGDLGLSTIAVREIARAPERASAIIGGVLGLRLTMAGFVLAGAWIAIWLWPMDPALRWPLSVFSLIVPLTALNTPTLIFQTAMRFEFAVLAGVTMRVLGLVFMGLLVLMGRGVTAMLAALLAAEICGVIVTWTLSRRLVRVAPRLDTSVWRPMLRASAPLAAGLLLVALVNRVDFIMLERMAAIEEVGLYGAAYRVTNMLEKFPLFVMATMFPIMSRLALVDVARLRQVYRRTVWRLAWVGIAAGVAFAVTAPWVLAALFGEPFRAAAGALRWLILATVCLYLALAGANLLIASGRPHDNTVAMAAGVAINIGLNIWLIPAYGIRGAAMATAASYAVVLVITLVAVERLFARARYR